MAVEKYNAFWRKSLAIGVLPFAALGIAGCDNSEPVEEPAAEEEVVEEEPAATGDTMTGEGEEDTLADEEVVEEDPTAEAG